MSGWTETGCVPIFFFYERVAVGVGVGVAAVAGSCMWSHSNWEEESNKMDAHAELQNSVAKTRTVMFVCQPEVGERGTQKP